MKFTTLLLPLSLLLGACATTIAPADLQRPVQLTCFTIPTPLTSTNEQGLLKIVWVTRLERGPYVSERVDADGTYYRAPQGGVSYYRPDMLDKPAGPLSHMTHDGGIWIPKNPNLQPHLYTYFSTASAPVRVPSEGADCSSVAYSVDPKTQGVSVVEFAAGGAIGGATGGAIARGTVSGSSMSYGQSIGTGAVGGAIGGLIVAGIINMDVGKIVTRPPLADPAFTAAIRAAANDPIPLRKVDGVVGSAAVASESSSQ